MALFKLVESLVALVPRAGEDGVRKHARWIENWNADAAVATTTAIAEVPAARAKMKCRLVGALFIPAAAVTGAATNFFTLLIDKRTAAVPGTPVNLITYAADTATTDDIAAFASKDLLGLAAYVAGAATDFNLEEGDVLTAEVTKAASGMTFPAGRVMFIFEGRD